MATATEDSTRGRPSVGATLLLLIGVVPFMAGFFGLYNLLGVGMSYVGLLFLLYWAAILRQARAAYLPSLLGGLTGILLGWLLIGLPPLIGLAGTIISIAALLATLFCFMRGHALLIVNNATMLFLTVATISELKITSHVVMMVKALLLAAAYMGAVSVLAHFAAKLRSRKSAASPPR